MTDILEIINEQEVLGKQFRIYGTLENPLFLAKDVAEWIEYDKSSINKMLNKIDESEKVRNIVPTLGGNQEMWLLTEDGLYELLMQSRKPIAKDFKKEVKKILKQIRQTGGYIPTTSNSTPLTDEQIMAQALIIAQKTIEKRNKELEVIKQELYQKDTELAEAKPKVEFYNHLNQDLQSTYTVTSIAKMYGMSAKAFNELLHSYKVQYKSNGHWVLYSQWDNKGLVVYTAIPCVGKDGSHKGTVINMTFTGHGFVWIVNSLALKGIFPNDMSKVPNIATEIKTF